MSRARTPIDDVPEDEMEEMDEDEDGFDDMPDAFEALTSLLATEDGETIATTLVSLKDATEKIGMHLEMQNKILVKILSAVAKSKACDCTGSACRPSEAA